MLEHIKVGDKFICNRSIQIDNKPAYIKGKVYTCDRESPDPTKLDTKYTGKYMCGFITDEQGDKTHAWPYFPEIHPCCRDRYTDYFTKIN